MPEDLVPTAKLRWVETEDAHTHPVAMTFYYGQYRYFTLQQWWQDMRVTTQTMVAIGEWRDVEEDV